MKYSLPWSRTFAEWDWDDDGWYPATDHLEPWISYLRRIAKRLVWRNR
jgi:hypothetical protein